MFSKAPQRKFHHPHRQRNLCAAGGAALFAALLFIASPSANASGLPARAAQTASASQPVVVQPGAPGKPSKTLPPSTKGTLPARSQADVDWAGRSKARRCG